MPRDWLHSPRAATVPSNAQPWGSGAGLRIDEMNDYARREVYAEAKILQELSHPTIIKYFAAHACWWLPYGSCNPAGIYGCFFCLSTSWRTSISKLVESGAMFEALFST